MCCSDTLQCVAVCCSVSTPVSRHINLRWGVAVWCSSMRCVAVRCGALYCVKSTAAHCNTCGSVLQCFHFVLHCAAVLYTCCSVLQCFHFSLTTHEYKEGCCSLMQHIALHYSVLQYAAVCCSALQCVAVRCSVMQRVAAHCSVLQCVAVRCSALQCVAVRCSVLHCNSLKCVAVLCSDLQCFAMRCSAEIQSPDRGYQYDCLGSTFCSTWIPWGIPVFFFGETSEIDPGLKTHEIFIKKWKSCPCTPDCWFEPYISAHLQKMTIKYKTSCGSPPHCTRSSPQKSLPLQ